MAETRTLGPLLDYAMDEAMSLVGAKRGFLILVSPEGTLDFRVKRSIEADQVGEAEKTEKAEKKAPHVDSISKSILGEVVKSAQPVITPDALVDPRFGAAASVMRLGLRSVMCVPLITRGQVIGAIYVENPDRKNWFDDDDLPPLLLFANQAAVSIENAALNDELEARITARTAELEAVRSQLEEGWRDAVELNRKQTVLFGNVAHDVRAPLSVIVSSMRLMLEGAFGDLTTDQIEWINKSLDAASLIQDLMNDVFDLTKIDQGHLTLYPESVTLVDFLTRIYRIGQGLPWTKGVLLELDIHPDLQTLTLDPRRIAQVLLNLLSNALKFTTKGSVTLYAVPYTSAGLEAVLFGVRDTGEGIPPDLQDRLFQRFQQVDQNKARRRLGTGLGLAICRELVEMHGGRIWVESKPGSGSDFKFAIPFGLETVGEDAEETTSA